MKTIVVIHSMMMFPDVQHENVDYDGKDMNYHEYHLFIVILSPIALDKMRILSFDRSS